MVNLPPLEQLISRCRALAALDLILSPAWEGRYYSFNSRWSEGQLMASMCDGCGGEWWMIFHRDGWAALKGFDHESRAWGKYREKLSLALQRSIPVEMGKFSTEPAFRWSATSFAYFHPVGAAGWTRANDLTEYSAVDAGDAELLALLVGDASSTSASWPTFLRSDRSQRRQSAPLIPPRPCRRFPKSCMATYNTREHERL
jgi:hypothetical protein